jgi:membrane protease YdiL (CAAX protease family)
MALLGTITFFERQEKSSHRIDFSAYFDALIKRVSQIMIGIIALIVQIPLLKWCEKKISSLLNRYNVKPFFNEEAIRIFKFFDTIKIWKVSIIFKSVLMSYILVIGPILEEKLFMQKVFDWIKQKQSNPNSFFQKVLRIFLTSIVFSICKLSPWHGWNNIPIFIIGVLAGCILTSLREITGSIIPSTILHILHNCVSTIIV